MVGVVNRQQWQTVVGVVGVGGGWVVVVVVVVVVVCAGRGCV